MTLKSHVRDLIYIKRDLFINKINNINYNVHYFNYNVNIFIITIVFEDRRFITRFIFIFSIVINDQVLFLF